MAAAAIIEYSNPMPGPLSTGGMQMHVSHAGQFLGCLSWEPGSKWQLDITGIAVAYMPCHYPLRLLIHRALYTLPADATVTDVKLAIHNTLTEHRGEVI